MILTTFLKLRVSIVRVLRLLIMTKHTAKKSRYNSGKQHICDNIKFYSFLQLQTCVSDSY